MKADPLDTTADSVMPEATVAPSLTGVSSPGIRPVTLARDPQAEQAFRSRIRRRERQLAFQLSPLGWMCVDAGIAVISVLCAFILSPFTTVLDVNPEHVSFLACALSFATIHCLVAHIAGLHDYRMPREILDLIGRSCLVVGSSMIILGMVLYVFYFEGLGRYISGYVCLFATMGTVLVRVLIWKMSDTISQTITFLGNEPFCCNAYSFLAQHKIPYRMVSVIEFQPKTDAESICQWAIHNNVDEIVYDPVSCQQSDSELLDCLDEGVKISSYPDFVEENFAFVPVEQIDAKWILSASVEVAHPYYNGIKRLVDVAIAATGLIISLPILLLAMLLIKLTSRGPAIYRQERIGLFKRPFRMYKLRSMVDNAESNGAQWAKTGDQRVTRVGRFLRKTRIDEIPQFWNVLRGDMSLVGPRPERPEFVELLSRHIPFYLQRHLVKPGLTGWAQIHYPYGASIDDANNKLKYDLYYVKRASLLLDFQIALRTLGTVMSGSR